MVSLVAEVASRLLDTPLQVVDLLTLVLGRVAVAATVSVPSQREPGIQQQAAKRERTLTVRTQRKPRPLLMQIRMSSCVCACQPDPVGRPSKFATSMSDVYEAHRRRAAEAGLTVPEPLRREATRLAARPTVEEWLARTRRRPSAIEREDVLAALDEIRGEWPRAGR